MKKIINSRLYDTGTAEFIESYDNGYFENDFKYYSEALYRKNTGEYFLHGVGGAMSKYSEPCGHGMSSGEKIIPYTEEEAKAWAEANMSADAYMELFGAVAK